jgi:hypothetical protein
VSDHQSRRDDAGAPSSEGGPINLTRESGQTRQLVQALETALRDSMAELHKEVAEIKTRSHTDYHRLLYIFGAGVAALIAVFGWGFARLDDRLIAIGDRLSDRVAEVATSQARTDQKLDDLIARIPPVPSPPPHR